MTHDGCGGIFNDNLIANSPQSTSLIILKIRRELTKLSISVWWTTFLGTWCITVVHSKDH